MIKIFQVIVPKKGKLIKYSRYFNISLFQKDSPFINSRNFFPIISSAILPYMNYNNIEKNIN